MKRLLCFFGLHDWEYRDWGRMNVGERVCQCCGRQEERVFARPLYFDRRRNHLTTEIIWVKRR